MKQVIYIFLYLNIYTGFFCDLNAQKIKLQIVSETKNFDALLDSLETKIKFYNFKELKREVDSLQHNFRQIGFIESKLENLEKENDSLFIATFNLGERYLYIKVLYSEKDFNLNELEEISAQVSDSTFILPFTDLEKKIQLLTNNKTLSGNAFTKIFLSEIKKENNKTLTARIVLEQGNKRTIDSIVVKGYEKFPLSFLKHYAGIKSGKTFNQNNINKQNQELNQLGFVNTIKAPEVLFNENKTTVYLYLKKKNNNLFDGVVGFANNEETKKIIFNGYLNLELNNNLNFGEQLTIKYKGDGEDQQSFKAYVSLPYLLKSPIGIDLGLSIFKKDTTYITNQQEIKATYQINTILKSFIGYKAYNSSNLLDEAIVGITIEDLTSRFLTIGASYSKKQNNTLFPRKSFAEAEVDFGKRTLSNNKESQFKISLTIQHIFNLNTKNSIYIQNSSSLLQSEIYVLNELYRFGGINSIRGFNENSLDASLFSVFTTEYRYLFNKSIYLHSIIDVGYFENELFSTKQKIYSFGLGLGMQTKAGLLKFNIANGTNESQQFDFSNTKIHLSLSSRF